MIEKCDFCKNIFEDSLIYRKHEKNICLPCLESEYQYIFKIKVGKNGISKKKLKGGKINGSNK